MKASDYNLSPETDYTNPDDYVRFDDYLSDLQIEAAYQSVASGEFIPYRAIAASVATELDIPIEDVSQFRLVGGMVKLDRRLNAMTIEEREEYDEQRETFREDLDAMAVATGFHNFEDMIVKLAEKHEGAQQQIDGLNKLYEM